MRIKIIKSSLPGYWYRDKIGEEFEVTDGRTDEECNVYVSVMTDVGREDLPVRNGDFALIDEQPETVKPTKLVYVACSYRTEDPIERELNIKAAQHAGYKLAKAGFYPVMPTVNTAYFDRIGTDNFWLSATLELMKRCDVVYVVDGSHESSGVKGEIAEAKVIGMPVYIRMEDLIEIEGVTS